jgi:DNA-binding GntR family transcriptional regulator
MSAIRFPRLSDQIMDRVVQIHRVSVADQVATVLRQRILNGELLPGTPLQEAPLSASLGVSRNTTREATRILALEGRLHRNVHRGVAVSRVSLNDVREIYQLRRMLEIPAVLGAKAGRAAILPELRIALEGYESAIRQRDWVRAVAFDLQFHSLLIRFHRNRRLESFYQRVIGELRVGMVLVDGSHNDPGGLIPVHRKLFQLLAAGKLKHCAAVLAQHLQDSESRLDRIMNRETPKRKAKQAISTGALTGVNGRTRR